MIDLKKPAYTETPVADYREFGLDQTPEDPLGLYIDLVKRSVCNLLYEDRALWRYDHHKRPQILNRFDLAARIEGEDVPTEAHTMIGWRRLSNIQECAENIFKNSVNGDFVETGVLRGGSAIFMRALLKAFGDTSRKVYACDTFVYNPTGTDRISRVIVSVVSKILKVAAHIPIRGFRLWLFRFMEKHQKSFPRSANPSDEWVNTFLYVASNVDLLRPLTQRDRTSLAAVQSHFARYGLLDSQVIFLKGFFSDTLPTANIESIALLRCDGDSFESTYGVLIELYAKVSPGGFVIIDDYNSFSDCKRAVDQFREENHITAPLLAIDNLSTYWQKPRAEQVSWSVTEVMDFN